MKKTLTLFICFLLTIFIPITSEAEQVIIAENVWIREAPPSVNVLAAYMTLRNPTDKDIRLIRAESPAFENIMFHKTELEEGMAKMRHADEILIPARSSFQLTPGGHHMMLMGKKGPLKEGDSVRLILIFKEDEHQEITAKVKKTSTEDTD